MNLRPSLILIGVCALGLATGYMASSLRLADRDDARGARELRNDPAPDRLQRTNPSIKEDSRTATAVKLAMASPPHSSDELSTALALDQYTDYERIALWMLDASAEDIAAYWMHHRDIKIKNRDITDLVFINWTRLDPKAATAAVNGTKYDEFAWWGWACHDPEKALAEALSNRPERVPNVTWGIGEFHGDWMREHFDQIPEDGRRNALMALGKWDDTNEPLGVLNFFKENNASGYGNGVFASLVRQDPWAAYDWVRENGGMGSDGNYSGQFLDVLKSSHPEMLGRIADLTDSLELKAQMSQLAFEDLLSSDPAAALRSAQENKSPLMKVNALAMAGISYAKSDPDKAVSILKEMLSSKLPEVRIITPDSGTTSYGTLSSESYGQLVKTLIKKEPSQLMEIAMNSKENGDLVQSFGREWANTNLSGFSEWVNAQTDPAVRDASAGIVISQLLEKNSYSEAMDWAAGYTGASEGNSVINVYYNWYRNDPGSAKTWLKSANIPENQKTQLNRITSQ